MHSRKNINSNQEAMDQSPNNGDLAEQPPSSSAATPIDVGAQTSDTQKTTGDPYRDTVFEEEKELAERSDKLKLQIQRCHVKLAVNAGSSDETKKVTKKKKLCEKRESLPW